MTLSNKNAIRTFGLINHVGGNMGTASYPVAVGKGYVFNVDGYKVIKEEFYNGRVSYVISGKNILESYNDTISMVDVLDMNKVEAINDGLRAELLSNIMNSDLTRLVKFMTDNKKGFTFLMGNLMSEGLSKDLAFASVVKDYYSHEFNYLRDTNSILKVMVKYGYKFTNMIEANKLIRN